MTSINQNIEIARARLLERWQHPHPEFASGSDPRSSERGLLGLLYGCMTHAARYQWLNGGRTLVDKTYLAIFWSAQELDRLSISFDTLAANLDRFIRQHLAEQWHELDELEHEARHQRAIALVDAAAVELFGSQRNETAASHLLFFLCPQLPLFPYSAAHAQGAGLTNEDGSDYPHYHQACRQRLARQLPLFAAAPVPAVEGAPHQAALLHHGDWWQRRLLAQQFISPQ